MTRLHFDRRHIADPDALRAVNLTGSDLTGANLTGTVLAGTTPTGTVLASIGPCGLPRAAVAAGKIGWTSFMTAGR
jgi:uncharacterized protein YjbI with pentapeptide repeats